MVAWKDFSTAAPDLARVGRALLSQFGVGLAFLSTVRGDGAPRLHPVCPVISDEHLFVLITPTSPKYRDLVRDGRYALQTFPSRSRAATSSSWPPRAAVEDAATRTAVLHDARHRADESEALFELWIERGMHTSGRTC